MFVILYFYSVNYYIHSDILQLFIYSARNIISFNFIGEKVYSMLLNTFTQSSQSRGFISKDICVYCLRSRPTDYHNRAAMAVLLAGEARPYSIKKRKKKVN